MLIVQFSENIDFYGDKYFIRLKNFRINKNKSYN